MAPATVVARKQEQVRGLALHELRFDFKLNHESTSRDGYPYEALCTFNSTTAMDQLYLVIQLSRQRNHDVGLVGLALFEPLIPIFNFGQLRPLRW